MGLQDRAYYRDDSAHAIDSHQRSAVGTLIVITIVAWVAQLIFRDRDPGWGGVITRLLAVTPTDLFDGFPKIWKTFTANFAHDWKSPWHVFGNMLFLYFFGREVEHLVGRREFYVLYFISGTLAILAEVIVQQMNGHQTTLVLGASGAVTAVVVFYTLLYPTRKILFFFFIPAPVWALCAFFVVQDVLGATSAGPSEVAHFAHLVGAVYGLLYWRFDLRFETWSHTLRGLLPGKIRRSNDPKPLETDVAVSERDPPADDAVTQRIDELLDKIRDGGMDSLSEQERNFLSTNSAKYRRP